MMTEKVSGKYENSETWVNYRETKPLKRVDGGECRPLMILSGQGIVHTCPDGYPLQGTGL